MPDEYAASERCEDCGEPLAFHGPEGECPEKRITTDDVVDGRDLLELDRNDVEW